MNSYLPPFNLQGWINDNREKLKPPVGNQVIYKDSDFDDGETGFEIFSVSLDRNEIAWKNSIKKDGIEDFINVGDMKGWMVWVDSTGGLTNTTFTFEGSPRSGIVSPTESITRLISGSSYGYNFVGNPFTSAIDWDNTTGWIKTNIDTAIYTYNNGNWATYSNGTGTNGGSRYIAMNQGFFVQVTDDGSTSGTLTATNDVQVNNSNKVYAVLV